MNVRLALISYLYKVLRGAFEIEMALSNNYFKALYNVCFDLPQVFTSSA